MTSPRLDRLAADAASPEATEQRARAKAMLNAIREANNLIGSLTIAAEFGDQKNTLDVEVLTRLFNRLSTAMRPVIGRGAYNSHTARLRTALDRMQPGIAVNGETAWQIVKDVIEKMERGD